MPDKSYWEGIGQRPGADAQNIHTLEETIKRTTEMLAAGVRVSQQRGKLFSNGNLFTGISELSKIAIGLSPLNSGNLKHMLGRFGDFIPGGTTGMTMMLLGGLASAFFFYGKPNQPGAVPPTYPTVAAPTTSVAPVPPRPAGNTTVIGANGNTTTTTSTTGSGSTVGGVVITPRGATPSATGAGTPISTGNGPGTYTNPVTSGGTVPTTVSGSTAGGATHGTVTFIPRG